jgi:hypothetical protein
VNQYPPPEEWEDQKRRLRAARYVAAAALFAIGVVLLLHWRLSHS